MRRSEASDGHCGRVALESSRGPQCGFLKSTAELADCSQCHATLCYSATVVLEMRRVALHSG